MTDLSINRSICLGRLEVSVDTAWIDRARWRLIHPLIFCAWCGRVRVVGHWFGRPRELEVVAHARRNATSGICPSCFASVEPREDIT